MYILHQSSLVFQLSHPSYMLIMILLLISERMHIRRQRERETDGQEAVTKSSKRERERGRTQNPARERRTEMASSPSKNATPPRLRARVCGRGATGNERAVSGRRGDYGSRGKIVTMCSGNGSRGGYGAGESSDAAEEEMRAMTTLPEDMLARVVRLAGSGWAETAAAAAAAARGEEQKPEAEGSSSIGRHALGVATWRSELARGRLPLETGWPREEAFSSTLLEAMAELDMARFCARNKELVDTLLRNMLELYERYLEAAAERLEEEEQPPSGREGGDEDAKTASSIYGGEDSSASGSASSDNEKKNDDAVGEDENTEDVPGQSTRASQGWGAQEREQRTKVRESTRCLS